MRIYPPRKGDPSLACHESRVLTSWIPLLQVGILYFQPSVFRCILLRWVRLLGFATVYGTLTLKLYRCDTKLPLPPPKKPHPSSAPRNAGNALVTVVSKNL